ncbi:hypothetical protein ASPWEDRAFT_181420 [Aspergillus wentii DTO 134E9]|uniref:Uncharacterized protein n=1 Tax=Aspergillus wentii DTO 134E9 TaxID=1073089 RepID=A0A1L9RND4_ASPWE|nr:uncharacterized protein ASPWEDRAFT_181420 [Aspergillus wentii DTO 134E9]KAI9926060.1 hypothetical protein MW887_004519 [Aspergillus wentii]OJJ36403.1 hypothetical protein ASPWEDRAFT_181420 [Aspergillus wentii DTO 134E9]
MKLLSFLPFLAFASAVPFGINHNQPKCNPHEPKYKTLSKKITNGPSSVMAVACRPEIDDCTLSTSEAYSVSVAVTVGIDLGVNTKTASAGIGASVSYSTSRITTDTGAATCPKGGWTCGLAITPSVLEVHGNLDYTSPVANPCLTPKPKSGDYTVQYPMKDSQGKPRITVWACACPDRKGWADKGAPKKCPANCGGAIME